MIPLDEFPLTVSFNLFEGNCGWGGFKVGILFKAPAIANIDVALILLNSCNAFCGSLYGNKAAIVFRAFCWAKILAVVAAGFGMGLLKAAEKAEGSFLGDEGVLVLSLLVPNVRDLEVKAGIIGVLFDGLTLDLGLELLLSPFCFCWSLGLEPAEGIFLNCLKSLKMELEAALLFKPLVGELGILLEDDPKGVPA